MSNSHHSEPKSRRKPAKSKDPKFWLRVGCLVFAVVMILSVFMTLISQLIFMV